MQKLGLGRGFRRGPLVYGDGDVGSTCFLHESENRVRSRRCNGAPGFREEQRGDELDSNLHPRPAAIYSGRLSCPAAASPRLGDGEVLWLSGKRGGANEGKGVASRGSLGL
jgi:hypothetical protein